MDEHGRPASDAMEQAEVGWLHQSGASAANYERHAVTAIHRPWAERLVDRLAPLARTRVLDLACGTGVVARLAAERIGPGGSVVGIDISPAMLAVARGLPGPPGAPVAWQLGSAAALPYRAASFDVATCAFGLMFISDRQRMLAEARRVLVPGGRLALSVWGDREGNPVEAALIAVLHRYAGAEVAGRSAVGYTLGDQEEVHRLLTGAGFRAVRTETLSDEHRLPLSAMLNRVVTPGMDEETRFDARSNWSTALTPYIDADIVRYPVTAHLVTAIA